MMDLENLLKIGLPALGIGNITGGLIVYWIKSKIATRQKEREWKKQFFFEDLKKQRELLLEFLGDPWNDIESLSKKAATNIEWRDKIITSIQAWISHNQPYFPKHVQSSLWHIASNVGSFIHHMDKVDISDEAIASTYIWKFNTEISENRDVIDKYLAEIDEELKYKS